ncbi:hypothetical protein KRP22_005433 [Phytophthora ramorum]|nr:ATP-binding cassette sub-family C member 2 [Phytophthora ramorum]
MHAAPSTARVSAGPSAREHDKRVATRRWPQCKFTSLECSAVLADGAAFAAGDGCSGLFRGFGGGRNAAPVVGVAGQAARLMIDNVPLDSLSLQDLRSRLTYIPQEVVLFSGTVRSNLDPTGVLEDERLWTVLRKCGGLANAIAKLARGLDTVVEGGAEEQTATFSQGQAQLLCIARALLRPSKVLCIDEATASIDHETERAISEAIASEFATSTVLTVAHRIQTIMHCHRVLLLDNGRIAESGDPKELAQKPQSLFYRLANSGDESQLL